MVLSVSRLIWAKRQGKKLFSGFLGIIESKQKGTGLAKRLRFLTLYCFLFRSTFTTMWFLSGIET